MPKTATKKVATKKPKQESANNDLFAVIATGGKQYIVSPGTKVKVEKMKGEFKEGDTITFDQVLLIDDGLNEHQLMQNLIILMLHQPIFSFFFLCLQ